MKAWLVVVALLVNGIALAATREVIKRQVTDTTCDVGFETGPNNEIILTCNGEPTVYLRGNNAMMTTIMAGQTVDPRVVNVTGGQVIEVDIVNMGGMVINTFGNIFKYTQKQCDQMGDPKGPGRLYTSTGQAFFINDGCTADLAAIDMTIANAPPIAADIEVNQVMDAGALVSNLEINDPAMGGFEMVLTGAIPYTVGIGQTLSYSGGMLSIDGSDIDGSDMNSEVMTLAVVDVGFGGFNIFNNMQTTTVNGPGTVYVGPNTAAFIGEFGNEIPTINTQVVMQAFTFNTNMMTGATIVTDNDNNNIIMLTEETLSFTIEQSSMGTYSGGILSFNNEGGQMYSVSGLSTFTVFNDNEVMINPPTFSVPTGGTVMTDPASGSAVFLSNDNPSSAPAFQALTPMPPPATYTIATDNDNVRNLMVTTGSPSMTTHVQTTTGSYVMPVDSSETVVYTDSEIQITGFNGMPNVIIQDVDDFITNTDNPVSPFGNFSVNAPAPFFGPGTISYSRGNGFYTTNPDLGSALSFQSDTAPIPRITFNRMQVGMGMVDDVSFPIFDVPVMVGDDHAITFEATSYTTTPTQEIIYSGGQVSVVTPNIVGPGTVTYNGGAEQVTYTDGNGDVQTIGGITTFNQFSGADITTTMSPDSVTTEGPGKIYVSSDGTTATFSNTNIVTSQFGMLIANTQPDYEVVDSQQLSTIIMGTYNRSMMMATVSYPGGGVLWSSTRDMETDALYVDDVDTSRQIQNAVGSLLTTTKSVPAKENGEINVIFNGRSIYTYSPVTGNLEFHIPASSSIDFINMMISGDNVPGGPYSPYDTLVIFDGVEVRRINSTDQLQTFDGPGFLLLPMDSTEAFYTNYVPTINYLSSSIQILRNFLSPPVIRPADDTITNKSQNAEADFGDSVTVFETANVILTCEVVGGRPVPTTEFFYRPSPMADRVLLNDSANVIIANNTVTLLGVTDADEGIYECEASNGVPPNAVASTTLQVRDRVLPMLQPGWYPFTLMSGDKLIFPNAPPVMETVILNEFRRLVLPCRVDGQPKGEVDWLVDDMPIEDVLPLDGFEIMTIVEGRSVLILDLENVFNDTSINALLGMRRITCEVPGVVGARGDVILTGQIIMCNVISGNIPCSTTCGYGVRMREFMCFRFTGPGVSETIDISDVPLTIESELNRQEVCTTVDAMMNMVICPVSEFQWSTSNWTMCSRTCGGGFRNRTVTCERVEFPINSRYQALVDMTNVTDAEPTMCAMSASAGERPTERELCNEQSCPFWQTSKFGPCSATCGGGIRVRTVECVVLLGRYKNMMGMTVLNVSVVNDSACGSEKPEETITCNEFPCFYAWQIGGPFGNCQDISLLSGPVAEEFFCRERPIVCVDEFGVVVNDSFCEDAGLVKPPTLERCGGGGCFIGIWSVGSYSMCSATCGYGTQTRELICYSPESFTLVPLYFCDAGSAPSTERACFLRNCEGMCQRDERPRNCELLARMNMCDSPFAMANNGTRCCVSCGGMAGGD